MALSLVLAIAHASTTAAGSELAWVAFDKMPTLSVQSFDLETKQVKIVADLGDDLGAEFTQVATFSDDGQYVVGIQEASKSGAWQPSGDCAKSPFPCKTGTSLCCSDPISKHPVGACYKVSSCSAIQDPAPQHGLLVGLDWKTRKTTFRHNTSICWSLAIQKSDPNSALCLTETKAPPDVWTNHLTKIDLRTGAQSVVGSFPSNLIATYGE
jgi:hypothetical protein